MFKLIWALLRNNSFNKILVLLLQKYKYGTKLQNPVSKNNLKFSRSVSYQKNWIALLLVSLSELIWANQYSCFSNVSQRFYFRYCKWINSFLDIVDWKNRCVAIRHLCAFLQQACHKIAHRRRIRIWIFPDLPSLKRQQPKIR